ncbi:MAG: hypothetical protein Kow0075_05160 [Salibacteraceae bacterium]
MNLPYLNNRVAILVLVMLCLAVSATSQKRADKLYNQNRYADAAAAYERYVRKNPEDAASMERLAHCYRNLRDFESAERYYHKADSLGGLSPTGRVNYGQTLIKNGKPDEAAEQLKSYLNSGNESFFVRLMLQSIQIVNSWQGKPAAFEVHHVSGLNSEYADFAPFYYRHGIAFTTARRADLVNNNGAVANNEPYLSVYYAPISARDGTAVDKPKLFLSNLYGDKHIGPVSIDSLHNKLYFSETRSILYETGLEPVKSFSGDIIKQKKLRNIAPLPFNSDSFSVAHPAISPDGSFIVFSSDMAGGSGKMDLYIAYLKSDGWSQPQRLSDSINTPLNEVFPYVYNDTTLYFASDGHAGYGGLDLFVSYLRNNSWSKPKNLLPPINSRSDDFGITFANSTMGYFSSERAGGMGKDDIYQFVKLAEPHQQERTEVAGVFEYEKLPPEGVTLTLFDENDNVIEVVQTDSNGNFVFKALPPGKEYRIKVDGVPDSELNQASMYLVNSEGQKVQILERFDGDKFVFKTLPRDEVESLALIEESDRRLGFYEIFGQLYSELPKDYTQITIELLDDNGNLISTHQPDSLGLYFIPGLSKHSHYIVRVKGDTIYRSSVYYQEDEGPVRVSENNEYFSLESLMPTAPGEVNGKAPTRGYVTYDGRALANVRLILLDSNYRDMRAVVSDTNGFFDFGVLNKKAKYTILLPESVGQLPGDVKVVMVDEPNNVAIKTVAKKRTLHIFTAPDESGQYDPSLIVAQGDSYEINGQIYKKLPGDLSQGLTIRAFDEDGNIVETVVVDASGNFRFTKLKPRENYLFQTDEEDPTSFNLNMYSPTGQLLKSLRWEELSAYVYRKLARDEAYSLALMQDDDTRLKVELVAGQVFKKLPGDYKPGIMIYAFDDQGNVIDSAMTDSKGNFRFTRLQRDENFVLKVDDNSDDELSIGFFNFDGHIDGYVKLDQTKSFTYSKIILEAAGDIGRLNEEDDSEVKIYGQIYKKLPGDYKSTSKIYALDESGNILDVATLDEDGKFVFTRLEKEANYTIKLEDENENVRFALLDAEGKVLDELSGDDGEWKFTKLDRDKYHAALMVATDESELKQPVVKGQSAGYDEVIYFDYRDYSLDDEDIAKLDKVAHLLQSDPQARLKIFGHHDYTEWNGDYSYATARSAEIASYLLRKGISTDRIFIKNWNDDKPVVDCRNIPCGIEQRAQNQRCELEIVSQNKMRPDPDLIITYGFEKWRLPDEHNLDVYHLIKNLRNNPEWNVLLDGYADTWGPVAANERISQLRVKNLANLLVLKGIDEKRIEYTWHGETIPTGGCKPAYPCPVDMRKQNRRVEVRIIKTPTAP